MKTKPVFLFGLFFSFISVSNQVGKVVRVWVSLSSMTPRKSVSYPKSSLWLRSVAGSLHASEIRTGMPLLEPGCLQSRRPEPGRGVPVGAVFLPSRRLRPAERQRHLLVFVTALVSVVDRRVWGERRGHTAPRSFAQPSAAWGEDIKATIVSA